MLSCLNPRESSGEIKRKEIWFMKETCPNKSVNRSRCTCTYPGCNNHAVCCECLHTHLANKELPGCCFPAEVEKKYDRSFRAFAKAWNLV